jgi:hypothetical protein
MDEEDYAEACTSPACMGAAGNARCESPPAFALTRGGELMRKKPENGSGVKVLCAACVRKFSVSIRSTAAPANWSEVGFVPLGLSPGELAAWLVHNA